MMEKKEMDYASKPFYIGSKSPEASLFSRSLRKHEADIFYNDTSHYSMPSSIDLTQKVNIKEFLTKSIPKYKISPRKISVSPSRSVISLDKSIHSTQKNLVEMQEEKVGKFYYKTIENSRIFNLIKKQ